MVYTDQKDSFILPRRWASRIRFLISFMAFCQLSNVYGQEAAVKRRILTMPFENVSGNKDYEWLAESLADNFKTELIKSGNFEVLDVHTFKKVRPDFVEGKQSAGEMADLALSVNCEGAVIGRYTVVKGTIRIEVEGIDSLSRNIVAAEKVYAKGDGSIFASADNLVLKVTGIMIERLQPITADQLKKRDKKVERQLANSEPIAIAPTVPEVPSRPTYGGMIVRTVVAPGWGHLYASQRRGWVYLGLWAGATGGFIWSQTNFSSKQSAYQSASSDFTTKYNDYNSASKLRGYFSYGFLAVYAVTLADMLFFGKSYVVPEAAVSHGLSFNFGAGADGGNFAVNYFF